MVISNQATQPLSELAKGALLVLAFAVFPLSAGDY